MSNECILFYLPTHIGGFKLSVKALPAQTNCDFYSPTSLSTAQNQLISYSLSFKRQRSLQSFTRLRILHCNPSTKLIDPNSSENAFPDNAISHDNFRASWYRFDLDSHFFARKFHWFSWKSQFPFGKLSVKLFHVQLIHWCVTITANQFFFFTANTWYQPITAANDSAAERYRILFMITLWVHLYDIPEIVYFTGPTHSHNRWLT